MNRSTLRLAASLVVLVLAAACGGSAADHSHAPVAFPLVAAAVAALSPDA
jgi:hypothetical protein